MSSGIESKHSRVFQTEGDCCSRRSESRRLAPRRAGVHFHLSRLVLLLTPEKVPITGLCWPANKHNRGRNEVLLPGSQRRMRAAACAERSQIPTFYQRLGFSCFMGDLFGLFEMCFQWDFLKKKLQQHESICLRQLWQNCHFHRIKTLSPSSNYHLTVRACFFIPECSRASVHNELLNKFCKVWVPC